jgi:hypothetical protein
MVHPVRICATIMDQSESTQNRRHRRSNVLMKATLELPGSSLPVLLRNLSEDGALVQADDLPAEGARILFHRDGLSVPSRIAWSQCGFAGLHFDFPLFPKEMLRHVPTPKHRVAPPVTRRPGLACKPLSPGERLTIERWATEATRALGD